MTQRLGRGGLLLVAVLAIGCSRGSLRTQDPDGGGWMGVPAHDAGPTDVIRNSDAGPLGAPCTAGGGCRSGFCVDGVCCETACTGGCQSCAEPAAPGTCVMRPAGARPRQATDCPATDASSCGTTGNCDGEGACQFHLGTVCVPGTCSDGVVTGAKACNGQGVCMPGVTMLCLPFACDPIANGCATSCTSDDQCVGRPCHDGVCGDPGMGHCVQGEDCITGFCADHVCCNTACEGPCVSCALPGHIGSCTVIPEGMADPRALCVDEGAATCGQDGACDGNGGCQLYPAGVACAAPTCAGNVLMQSQHCDGVGTCLPSVAADCTPYLCGAGSCRTGCATSDDCVPGKSCLSGSCGSGPSGDRPCVADDECLSGFCAQGVCCATRCDSPCFSCALAGSLGTCLPDPLFDPADLSVCEPAEREAGSFLFK